MSDIKRVRYFNGEFLVADDFNAEQDYHRQMRYRHNKNFHKLGIVTGLDVTFDPGDDTFVTISPGLAVDKNGQEIILQGSGIVDFNTPDYAGNGSYYITISWKEAKIDPDENGNAKRYDETPVIATSIDAPLDPETDLILARVTLKVDKTINTIDRSDRKISAVDVGNDAVTSSKIAEADGTSGQITDNGSGVKTGHIQDEAVTEAKLAAAAAAKLVTNGNTHNHSNGDGAQISHGSLNMDDGVNPHGVAMSQLTDLNANNGNIRNLAAPTANDHAANKLYVDDKTGGTINSTANISSVNTPHNRQVNASGIASASGDNSQVNASHNCTAAGEQSQINASVSSSANNYTSQVNASFGGSVNGNSSQVNASLNSTASGNYSQVNACDASGTSFKCSQVNTSYSSVAINNYSQVNSSYVSTASGEYSQVSSSEYVTASGQYSQVSAAGKSWTNNLSSSATGKWAQVNASVGCTASGENSQVNASYESVASGDRSQVNASYYSEVSHWGSQINASVRVASYDYYRVCGGYSSSGTASTSNRKWELDSGTGDISHAGTVSTSFADYGEFFENLKKGEIGKGVLIALEGEKVRPAKKDEDFIGVVSGTAAIRLGDSPFCWHGRYLVDDWGQPVYEEIKDPDWQPKKVPDEKWKPKKGQTEADRPMIEVETEKDRPTIRVQKENPDYDPQKEQKPRSQRPNEWTLVGLLGQVYVRCDKTVKPGDFVKSDNNGIGTKADEKTKLRAMKVTKPFNAKQGYAIVYCLLN
jgi:hypothetical protein